METYRKAEIVKMAEAENVEFIRLQFTDMFGMLKSIAVPSGRLQKALEENFSIDPASLEGIAKEAEADLYLKPDLNTFAILPWRPQNGKVARLLCDVCNEDGTECAVSPRGILKKSIEKANKLGYTLKLNPECEFFLFHTDENGLPTTVSHERAGYLDTSPIDLGENTRREIILTLEEMGYVIDSSHHEIATAQHEIDFTFEDALATADKVMTFKMAVRTIARRYGLYATFMPKPRKDANGSGMHLNMRLFKDGQNAFTDVNGALSRTLESFLAGIILHLSGMTAIFNPLVNSYKRLSSGFFAPSEITSPDRRQNALIRVRKKKNGPADLELRSPDSAANPYLLAALCLEAGLDGIEKGLSMPEELKEDLRALTGGQGIEKGGLCLPENLGVALNAMQNDSFIREVLGESFVSAYQNAKKTEWKRYLEEITPWELDHYLYLV